MVSIAKITNEILKFTKKRVAIKINARIDDAKKLKKGINIPFGILNISVIMLFNESFFECFKK
jgi:hypothetical protein